MVDGPATCALGSEDRALDPLLDAPVHSHSLCESVLLSGGQCECQDTLLVHLHLLVVRLSVAICALMPSLLPSFLPGTGRTCRCGEYACVARVDVFCDFRRARGCDSQHDRSDRLVAFHHESECVLECVPGTMLSGVCVCVSVSACALNDTVWCLLGFVYAWTSNVPFMILLALHLLPPPSCVLIFSRLIATSYHHIVQSIATKDSALVAAQDPEAIGQAIRKGIMDFDGALFQKVPRLRSLQDISGSTMVATIVTAKHVILANVGDSRAVIARGGKVARTTEDHKPQSAQESARVIEAGGYIMMGRVCGNLAVGLP